MSFSSDVKNELAKQIASSRHCQLAELSAIVLSSGLVRCSESGIFTVFLQSDATAQTRKFFTILKKAFNIEASVLEKMPQEHYGGKVYVPVLCGADEISSVLKSLHLIKDDGYIRTADDGVSHRIVRQSCCKRAFLRDTFLCVGSVSDPSKSYHLEFVCTSEKFADDLKEMIESFDIEARIVMRKKYYVVYIKESTAIVDLLNVMEAPISLMNMENERIVKEMRNSINRRVNCETANITKTVNAASRQTTDILYLRDHYGFENLPKGLEDMARVRLQYPDATLLELGKYLDPPVGKSGVNHRLRKLSELADKIRG
ncbi:DNA-binding protein WhiA [Butyrivibrio sp. VCD2006]|uniref:DNA-binding protein WhiA n=1 Tax=Butyrivibrio sp. VCD2006 TaxID=1280664 RepID=UPI00047D5855|nr:DNA-binding protein WhiA [Butyrivibrio sp. VCD2006]